MHKEFPTIENQSYKTSSEEHKLQTNIISLLVEVVAWSVADQSLHLLNDCLSQHSHLAGSRIINGIISENIKFLWKMNVTISAKVIRDI